MTKDRRNGWPAATVIGLVAFVAGIVVGWWMRSAIVSPRSVAAARARAPVEAQVRAWAPDPPPVRPRTPAIGTTGTLTPGAKGAVTPRSREEGAGDPVVADLAARKLEAPIEGADVVRLRGSFEETHSGHRHEAVDILAPRGTPVHAVESGTIAKLFESKAGGHTIYEYDPSGRYSYYYAHLDHYAAGLHDGNPVKRGQVIGYVGTSGNAPPETPHLHFTIFELNAPNRWWQGRPIDPARVYER